MTLDRKDLSFYTKNRYLKFPPKFLIFVKNTAFPPKSALLIDLRSEFMSYVNL